VDLYGSLSGAQQGSDETWLNK